MKMYTEKEYLKNNPGKHKMNVYCSSGGFYKLESVNDKKVSDIDLLECIQTFDSNLSLENNKISLNIMGDKWIISKINNLDYVKIEDKIKDIIVYSDDITYIKNKESAKK